MSQCSHPRKHRGETRRDGTYLCGRCGRPVKAQQPVRHGTLPGWDKHRRATARGWSWPPCGKCLEAHRQYVRDYEARPEVQARHRERSRAKARALHRLRRLHSRDYEKFYAEELVLLQEGPGPALRKLASQVAETLAATGLSEQQLARIIARREATVRERGAWTAMLSLRSRMEKLRAGAPEADPGQPG